MGFASLWGNLLPASYKNVQAPTSNKVSTDAFEAEYDSFVAEQKRLKAEREAKAAAEKVTENFVGYMELIGETVPSEQVAEVAYQAFIQEDEKPKSKKKKKTETVIEETPEVTEEVAEN